MVRGGIPVKQASIASKHTTYSGSKSPSNTDKAVAQAAKDSSSAAKSVTDAAEKVESWEDPWKNAVDWFERFTTKYNNSIDLNEAKAENYSSYENKNKYLDKEIADLSKLKGGYQQAQGYYKYQAEAYADMIGLSQDLRKKVQGGEINIDLLDEDTKSKVEAYQKWYDKIHECESELEKLKKKEKEVDQQKLDNITDRFDDLKKVYSTSSSVIESRLKYREENGESQAPGSKYYKDVNSQRKAQEAQAALLEKEMVAYRAQMEKIRKKYGEGHELYKKALAGYNDLRDELYNCKQSAKELSNTMYELKEKAAEYKTAMYQGRSDNLSSFRDYKEATNYKGSKYGKLTVNIIKAASILGYKDAKNVSKWDTKKKNAMVKKLQSYGFANGGIVRNLIPASMGTLLGDAIMRNGDTGFIGAKPGETVLTQDFTKLLKPTTATMQEFTEVMQKAGTPSVKETPVRQEVTMNNDYQFVINGVDVNDMSELKKVIRGELDKHDKELAKEFKKFR